MSNAVLSLKIDLAPLTERMDAELDCFLMSAAGDVDILFGLVGVLRVLGVRGGLLGVRCGVVGPIEDTPAGGDKDDDKAGDPASGP